MTNADEQKHEVWTSGASYEAYVGRWSRLVAGQFIEWLDVPAGAKWLDVGCGTGALSATVLANAQPSRVVGIDASEAYAGHAASLVDDDRASFRTADAQDLPFADGEFDAAISGLVLNFVPDQERMVSEMRRVTGRGGRVAAYVWDYAGVMEMMRHFWDAAAEIDPPSSSLDEGTRFTIARPEALEGLFAHAGLSEVASRGIDIDTNFRDFDDYWSPFLLGQGSAPTYCASLDDDKRASLRERLRTTMPTEGDGSIHLRARAWAVKGTTR